MPKVSESKLWKGKMEQYCNKSQITNAKASGIIYLIIEVT